MKNFLFLLFFFLLYTYAEDCSPDVKAKFGACLEVFTDVREHANEARERNKDSKVFTRCLEFPKCADPLKCGGDSYVISTIDKMLSFCEVITYRETAEFAECDSKLDPNKSQCVKEWKPFPATVTDPVKMKENQKQACENYLGKDRCMEKEIKELCGAEIWEKFKKYFLALKKLTPECDSK